MLVLSRKKNESIIINDNITVTVIEIRGDKVRLGIEAPPDVSVDREEIWERKQQEVLVGGTSQPAAPVTAPLPDARPAGGSMPTLHEKPRIP